MARKSPFNRLTMRIMGEKSGALDQVRGRLVLLVTLFVVFYVAIAVRLVDTTIIQGILSSTDSYIGAPQAAAETDTSKFRSDITDRNGVLLATSLKTASLHADPKFILNPVETAKGLVKIFPELSYGDILQKLQSEKRFVWIKRNLTPDEQKKILVLGEPGLVFDYDYRRFYPQGALSAHMVGYSNIDGKGQAGIERSFDQLLKDNKTPLQLTIDTRLQHIVRREVGQAIKDFTAKAGAGIIMDVNSGEILAAVSLPDFDPHSPSSPKNNPEEMFNRLTLGVYELGSTFKIFTTAALLEKNHTSFSKKYDVREPVRVAGHTIHDFHAEKKPLTIPEIFMVSSNIGTVHMAQDIGTEALKKFYADLGLMSKMDFEIDEVGSPIIPTPWREINTLTASYGHGIAVTPMQLISGVCAIVNGGLKVTPHLIRQDKEPVARTRVVSKETSLKMRQLMRLVVTEGTARKANVDGYMIGGKTGTAEKNLGGRYSTDKRIATFVGAFPIDNPKYAILVMVDEPHPNKSSYGYATAGWVAAPAVGRIVSSAGSLLGMTPQIRTVDIADPLKQFVSIKEGN